MNTLSARLAPPPREGPPRRGFPGQRHEREWEQSARRHAAELGRELAGLGWFWHRVAKVLGLAQRTLRGWLHDDPKPAPLGRPILAAAREDRNEVLRALDELGPGVGVPALRQMFPHLARAAIEDLVRRYRRVWRKRNREPIHVLHWTRPGAVWAIDFHGPRLGVDGLDPYLIAVRDLASGRQLLWRPVRDATAATARGALAALFAEHGAPLVLKSDNGSAFIAAEFAETLAGAGVKILFSPARTPQYNGAIEAGIGSLTSRTEQHAIRRGHPGHWTWDDAEAARSEANATARPRGLAGPTPDELWGGRSPIAPEERRLFGETVERKSEEVREGLGEATDNDRAGPQQRTAQRRAIRSALVEQGLLYFTRKRIPLPIKRNKAASIT